MVSNMSEISRCKSSVSNCVTGGATRNSRTSPIFKISRMVMPNYRGADPFVQRVIRLNANPYDHAALGSRNNQGRALR